MISIFLLSGATLLVAGGLTGNGGASCSTDAGPVPAVPLPGAGGLLLPGGLPYLGRPMHIFPLLPGVPVGPTPGDRTICRCLFDWTPFNKLGYYMAQQQAWDRNKIYRACDESMMFGQHVPDAAKPEPLLHPEVPAWVAGGFRSAVVDSIQRSKDMSFWEKMQSGKEVREILKKNNISYHEQETAGYEFCSGYLQGARMGPCASGGEDLGASFVQFGAQINHPIQAEQVQQHVAHDIAVMQRLQDSERYVYLLRQEAMDAMKDFSKNLKFY